MMEDYDNMPKCGNCVAWMCLAPGAGECHRYAPKPSTWLQMRQENAQDGPQACYAAWPSTTEDDHCLEWVRDPGEEQPPSTAVCS